LAATAFLWDFGWDVRKGLGDLSLNQIYTQMLNEMLNEKSQKISKMFHCEKCNYNCSKKSEFDKHLVTAKHKRLNECINLYPSATKNIECICGKVYKQLAGLSRHKRTCTFLTENPKK
jgi:hypothetical protein